MLSKPVGNKCVYLPNNIKHQTLRNYYKGKYSTVRKMYCLSTAIRTNN